MCHMNHSTCSTRCLPHAELKGFNNKDTSYGLDFLKVFESHHAVSKKQYDILRIADCVMHAMSVQNNGQYSSSINEATFFPGDS